MPANALWIIAVIVAIIGVIVLVSGSVVGGIILLVVAALIGPGGYSIFNRRTGV
jgi:drug/metabolite transporter (DMT)-like permease